MKLRAGTLREAVEWYDFFQDLFSYTKNYCYNSKKYLNHKRRKLYKADTITEEEFLSEAGTGDLLLFQLDERYKYASLEYDNISLLIKAGNEIYVYSSGLNQENRLQSWKNFKKLQHFKDKKTAIYKKLHIGDQQIREIIHSRFYKFILIHNEVNHDLNLKQALENIVSVPIHIDRIKTRPNSINPQLAISTLKGHQLKSPYLSPENEDERKEKDIPSAQLVAVVYKFVGLLNAHTGIAEYLPNSFLKDIQLLKGAYLSGEYELALLRT